MKKFDRRAGAEQYTALVETYFARCREEKQPPTLPGLALALELASRGELEQLARRDNPTGRVLRRAVTRVEEAIVQAALRKECGANAKFLLQNGFGYREKGGAQAPEDIQVTVDGEEPPCG